MWTPSFTPVDSGGGQVANLYTYYASTPVRLRPRMSWSQDGSALLVASLGPRLTAPPTESSLWAIAPTNAAVTLRFTTPGSDPFVGILCHPASTDCDMARSSGKIIRRRQTGDTSQVATIRGWFFASASGRFLLYNPSAGAYPVGGSRMHLLDVTTGTTRATEVPDVSATYYGGPRPAAISDDGAEVDVVGSDGFTITRHRIDEGTSVTWTIPTPTGWTAGAVLDLRWVGTTLYALVEWRTTDQVRYIQHAADGGLATVLGTTKRSVGGGAPTFAWRADLRRLVVQSLSACDINPDYDAYTCAATQYELDLMRDGATTRIARHYGGFADLVMSPDGRWLGYGTDRIYVKSLPE